MPASAADNINTIVQLEGKEVQVELPIFVYEQDKSEGNQYDVAPRYYVRGGLVFTTQIVITPHQQLHDARLYLDNGWFQAMTFNAVAPQPSTQSAQGRWQVWDFGKIPAGTAFHVWISWQVNPTNIGRHSQSVALYDGGTPLMTAQRILTVFP